MRTRSDSRFLAARRGPRPRGRPWRADKSSDTSRRSRRPAPKASATAAHELLQDLRRAPADPRPEPLRGHQDLRTGGHARLRDRARDPRHDRQAALLLRVRREPAVPPQDALDLFHGQSRRRLRDLHQGGPARLGPEAEGRLRRRDREAWSSRCSRPTDTRRRTPGRAAAWLAGRGPGPGGWGRGRTRTSVCP